MRKTRALAHLIHPGLRDAARRPAPLYSDLVHRAPARRPAGGEAAPERTARLALARSPEAPRIALSRRAG